MLNVRAAAALWLLQAALLSMLPAAHLKRHLVTFLLLTAHHCVWQRMLAVLQQL
jgi:hypothetical protein